MKQTRATLRYAKALFSLAIEQNTLERCKQDMQFIADTCANSKDLSLLLKRWAHLFQLIYTPDL